ncbi:MAG: hypothetical protein CL466_07540 [Acidimicrobiaceae bacterium]|nr:hypothetical protein [Acidimicrobiaceae bacterium]|tara:strand:+ start:304 stop:987 length:684 start_codon:yes stop_codon:yes gene_type:complete
MHARFLVVSLLVIAPGCGGGAISTVDIGSTALSSTTLASPMTSAPIVIAPPTTMMVSNSTVPRTTRSTNCARLTDFEDPKWIIVNDGVMGGRSRAQGVIEDSVLTWSGTIVTIGGGFSSIRGPVEGEFAGATSLTLRIRNDGRRYELLVEDAFSERARVTHYNPIETIAGGWQEVSVPLTEMEGRVFGNPVMAEPFVPELATQVGVILADGIDGEFQFEIDWIDACP